MADHPMNLQFEADRIRPGLQKLGIDANYQIVTADDPDPVEETAAMELQRFLRQAWLNVPVLPESQAKNEKSFLLGCETNMKTIRILGDTNEIKILGVSAEDDAFHIKQIGADIVIAGANPRAVLHGVYALEDFIGDGACGIPDIKVTPYYRKRGSAVGYFFNPYMNLSSSEFTAEKAEYLARLGINQYTGEDSYPDRPRFPQAGPVFHLHQLVKSDVFPFQPQPVPELRRKIKSMSEICSRYGIDFYLELWEPVIPAIAGGIDAYPAEALGAVHRPWGGGQDGLERTLCINSPLVQAHYRDMIGKLVREYPDIKGVTFYNMDGSTWLCTPELCERCASAVHESPHNRYNPWESQAQFVSLLCQAAHAQRTNFDFRFWPVHFNGMAAAKLCTAAACDSIDIGWINADRELFIPHGMQSASPEFIAAQKACDQRQIPLYALCECNGLESIQRSLPFPFHVCHTISQYKKWGITHINEWTGPFPEHNPINALVMAAFLRDPDRNPAEFLKDLARRQFGEPAGSFMYEAWLEIKSAIDVWNGYRLSPLSGSQPYLSIGAIGGVPEAILPDIVKSFAYNLEIRTTVEPWRAADYQKFRTQTFCDDMRQMSCHLAEAARLAEKAVVCADSQATIGLCYYVGSPESPGRPTCKEYAGLNHASIALADALCQQRVNILRAVALLQQINDVQVSDDKKTIHDLTEQYRQLIREDIAFQDKFISLLSELHQQGPCLTRTGLFKQEIEAWIYSTREKIKRLRAYLAAG